MSAPLQLSLAFAGWTVVKKSDRVARELADRHYSRQTRGARDFVPPGRCVVLVSRDCVGAAVFAVVLNLDPVGFPRWRCCIFRNEGLWLSSSLITAASAVVYREWRRKYGELPGLPMAGGAVLVEGLELTTEVDPLAVRRKRDPGRCFVKAGWRKVRTTNGSKKGRADLVVFEAPR